MKNLFLSITFLLVGLAAFNNATDITGKWSGKVMDQFDVTYDFKVDGEKLTGTTTGPDGNTITIQNGMIKGDDLSFSIALMGNDTKITGKIKDDAITLTMPGMGGGDPISFILKKVK